MLDEIKDAEASQRWEGLNNAIIWNQHTSRPEPRICEVCDGLLALYDQSNTPGRPEPRSSEECDGSDDLDDHHLAESEPGNPEPRSSEARDGPASLRISRLEVTLKRKALSNHNGELKELSKVLFI